MAGRILFEFRNSLKSNLSGHLSYGRVPFCSFLKRYCQYQLIIFLGRAINRTIGKLMGDKYYEKQNALGY